jgi:hypothetical protein
VFIEEMWSFAEKYLPEESGEYNGILAGDVGVTLLKQCDPERFRAIITRTGRWLKNYPGNGKNKSGLVRVSDTRCIF